MMNIYRKIIWMLIFIIISITNVAAEFIDGSPYSLKDGKIFLWNSSEVIGADIKTFQPIPLPNGAYSSPVYAKDKNHIYINGAILEKERDKDSFEVLDGILTKDKNGIYRYDKLIEGVDIDTWEHIGSFYWKDKNFVYREGVIIEGASPTNFKVFESKPYGFGYDNNTLYRFGEKVIGVDGRTLKSIGKGYFKDSRNAYFVSYNGGEIIEGADAITFDLLENKEGYERLRGYLNYHAYDKDNYFLGGTQVTEDIIKKSIDELKDRESKRVLSTIIFFLIIALIFTVPVMGCFLILKKIKAKRKYLMLIIFGIIHLGVTFYIVLWFIAMSFSGV